MGNKLSLEKNDRRGLKLLKTEDVKGSDCFGQQLRNADCKTSNYQEFRESDVEHTELQARYEGDKKRRGVEESLSLQQRRRETEATRERDRLLEEQERRNRQLQKKHAREEMQRKAEEEANINRQHLQQKLAAMRQRESQRQDVGRSPLLLSLPGVCGHHLSSQGCADTNCRELHICREFLADICNYGASCRYGHSLTTAHNRDICKTSNLDPSRELVLLQQVRRAFQESDLMTKDMFVRNLTICFKFQSKVPCEWHECKRIHICRQFVVGACGRTGCHFGHDLHTAHNNEVLLRHRLTATTDDEILRILLAKERRRRWQKANSAATSGSAVIPRSHPISKPKQASASTRPTKSSHPGRPWKPPGHPPAGLSDELQCPVCLELFSRPTTLGCGHTFCDVCLQKTRAKNGDTCPLCCADISSAVRSVALDNIVRGVAGK